MQLNTINDIECGGVTIVPQYIAIQKCNNTYRG